MSIPAAGDYFTFDRAESHAHQLGDTMGYDDLFDVTTFDSEAMEYVRLEGLGAARRQDISRRLAAPFRGFTPGGVRQGWEYDDAEHWLDSGDIEVMAMEIDRNAEQGRSVPPEWIAALLGAAAEGHRYLRGCRCGMWRG